MHLKAAYIAPLIPSDHVITPNKANLDPGLLEQAKAYPDLEQQVIVHCEFNPGYFFGPRIRIWPTTYLIPKGGTSKSKLLQAEHISFYPEWTPIERFTLHRFTLIFEDLPKDCTSFDLGEKMPETGDLWCAISSFPHLTFTGIKIEDFYLGN